MEGKESKNDLANLLCLAVALWLGYLLALAAIDHAFYPRPVFRPLYYLTNGLDALLVLALTVWPRGRTGLGRLFVPLVILLLSVVPIMTVHPVFLSLPPGPAGSPEAIMLRLMPMMLMGLILTAWHYGWWLVLGYTIGTAGLNLAIHSLFRPVHAPFLPPVTVLVIQTVSFLLVGYFISTLMSRFRAQHASLQQANRELANYAGTLEDLTISRERNRMARELHDTLAHTLSALSVQLETVKAYFDVDLDTAQNLLDESLQTTRSGLTETRRALKALRASPLDDLGLLLALRKMVEESAARANLKLHCSLPDQLMPLPADVEQAVYRVAQEAVANVVRHASAENLKLHLSVNERSISLVVSDDGSGFNVQQGEATGHYGLPGMRERAQLAGGSLSIDSRPGQGTTVRLWIQGLAVYSPAGVHPMPDAG